MQPGILHYSWLCKMFHLHLRTRLYLASLCPGALFEARRTPRNRCTIRSLVLAIERVLMRRRHAQEAHLKDISADGDVPALQYVGRVTKGNSSQALASLMHTVYSAETSSAQQTVLVSSSDILFRWSGCSLSMAHPNFCTHEKADISSGRPGA